jgi:uracil-DNA glycosylase family 4
VHNDMEGVVMEDLGGFGDIELVKNNGLYLTKLKKSRMPVFPVFQTVQSDIDFGLEDLKGREVCLCARWNPDFDPVMPTGPIDSQYVFVGKEPVLEDIETGKIFSKEDSDGNETHCGLMLDWYLENLGLTRDSVYITNAIMCKPYGDLYFDSSNMIACAKLKKKEFEQLKRAKYFFALGTGAFQFLTGIFGSITSYMGQYFVWNRDGVECYIIPLPHPSKLDLEAPWMDKTIKMLDGLRFGQ